jgi:hypothetical protein
MKTGKNRVWALNKILDEDEEKMVNWKKDTTIQVHGVGLMPTRGAVSLPATKEGAA